MEKIYVTRKGYIEFGKDCDGYNCINLFLHNHTEKWNGRVFLTYSLYRSALSSLKKHLKNYKNKEDDLFLDKDSCQAIERFFNALVTGF